jgi:hypothetical protein
MRVKYMKKKAQAAFEFIVTYGWALLLILAAIAAFYMLDVGSYIQLQPDSCELFGQATCLEVQGKANTNRIGYITLFARNDFGTQLKLLNATITDDYFTCSPKLFAGNERTWNATQSKNITLTCGGVGSDFKSGSRTDSTVVLTYYRETPFCDGTTSNPNCILTIRGKISARLGKI